MVNISRSVIHESFELSVPITHGNSLAKLEDLLKYYTVMDSDVEGVRCENTGTSKDCKIFKINWSYSKNTYDRSTYLWKKTRLMNFVMENVANDFKTNWLEYSAASGGAFNNVIDTRSLLD